MASRPAPHDPTRRIVNVNWSTFYAVEFRAMEFLSSTAHSVSNRNKILISQWARIKGVTPNPALADFFRVDGGSSSSTSLEFTNTTGPGVPAMARLLFGGVDDNLGFNWFIDEEVGTDGNVGFPEDKWFHFLIAANTTNSLVLDVPGGNMGYALISSNQEWDGTTTLIESGGVAINPYIYLGSDDIWVHIEGSLGEYRHWQNIAFSQQFYQRKLQIYMDDRNVMQEVSPQSSRFTGYYFNRFNGATAPDATIRYEGKEIGVPTTSIGVELFPTPVIEMAETQIWIDATDLDISQESNRRLFTIRTTNEDGQTFLEPADPETGNSIYDKETADQLQTAILTMGQPTLSFRKGSGLKFQENKGTGGDFTLSAPITSFRPDPKVEIFT